jgi:hypothetical protein
MEEVRIAVVAEDRDLRSRVAEVFDRAPAGWSVRIFDRSAPADADVVVALDGGDVELDPERPEEALERIGHHLSSRRRVFVVTGTSGSGATTVALHLARDLAANADVTVIDLDQRWRGAPHRVGIHDPEARTWAQANDERSARLSSLPVPGGFRVMPPPVEPQEADLESLLAMTAGTVLVDAPFGPDLDAALVRATGAVLVCDATQIAARRAAGIVERGPDVPWAVVVNRRAPGDVPMRAIERLLGVEVSLTLPFTRSLRDAENRGTLVAPYASRWGRGVRRLARSLERL